MCHHISPFPVYSYISLYILWVGNTQLSNTYFNQRSCIFKNVHRTACFEHWQVYLIGYISFIIIGNLGEIIYISRFKVGLLLSCIIQVSLLQIIKYLHFTSENPLITNYSLFRNKDLSNNFTARIISCSFHWSRHCSLPHPLFKFSVNTKCSEISHLLVLVFKVYFKYESEDI